MAADLTVDNLCAALRHFLQEIAAHPERPVDVEHGLRMYGTPADDAMKTVMELFGGRLKITVGEVPESLMGGLTGFGAAITADKAEQSMNLWHPRVVEQVV